MLGRHRMACVVGSSVALAALAASMGACGGGAGAGDGSDAATDDASLFDLGVDGVSSDSPIADVGPLDTLTIDPVSAVLTVTDPAAPKSQTFTASGVLGGGAPFAVPAVFTVDDSGPGTIDPATGLYTTSNKAAGVVTVTASYGGKTATAKVDVRLSLQVASGLWRLKGRTRPRA